MHPREDDDLDLTEEDIDTMMDNATPAEICELPHRTIEKEDACERQRTARPDYLQADYTPPPPGDRSKQLPDDVLAVLTLTTYLSTACETAFAIDEAIARDINRERWLTPYAEMMHDECRLNQKFTGQDCVCRCHAVKIISHTVIRTDDDVVHACPETGHGTTACCGRTPFELPRGHRMTRTEQVTCTGHDELDTLMEGLL